MTNHKYEDYRDLIYKLAHKYAGAIEFEELVSCANLEFVKCLETYDPMKAKFITYLHINIHGMILEMIRKHKNDPLTNSRTSNFHHWGRWKNVEIFEDFASSPRMHSQNTYELPINDITPENQLEFKNTLKNLSNDAREIVQIIFDMPMDLINMIPERFSHGISKHLLQKYLRNQGWSFPRIWNAFKEITAVL